jgi:hypothetical protein
MSNPSRFVENPRICTTRLRLPGNPIVEKAAAPVRRFQGLHDVLADNAIDEHTALQLRCVVSNQAWFD